jgi:ERCC4-type nuclease
MNPLKSYAFDDDNSDNLPHSQPLKQPISLTFHLSDIPANNIWNLWIDTRESTLYHQLIEYWTKNNECYVFENDSATNPNRRFIIPNKQIIVSKIDTSITITNISKYQCLLINIRPLDIGDILLENPEQNICWIYERKSLEDLSQSIKDGRYKEQKMRLIAFRQQHILAHTKEIHLGFIVEGVLMGRRKIGGILEDTMWSSIINSMMRDKFYVLQTGNMEHTAQMVRKMAENFMKIESNNQIRNNNHYIHSNNQIENDSNKSFNNNIIENESYWDGIQIKKQKNLNPSIVYLTMMCQIPKVSKKTAEAIMQHYPKLKNLLLMYESLETVKEKEELLANIMIDREENDNEENVEECGLEDRKNKSKLRKKRIGKVLSKKIFEFLY